MEGLDKYLTNEPNTYEKFDLRNSIHLGDCLEVMKKIPTAGVDLILCDLPYGTTETNWDNVLPFEKPKEFQQPEYLYRLHGDIG